MDLHNLIKQLVWWGPTVLFLLIILFSFYVGYKRGFRKSFILFINSFICLVISIGLYLCLVDLKAVDEFLLKAINFFLGSGQSLQSLLGVSASCSTLHEVILEAIPRNMNYMDGLALILEDNGQYLSTLVDLSYRIIFGLVMFILYYVFLFIGYIIYLIFFREGKYLRRTEKEFLVGESQIAYHKNSLGGGLVGLSRGVFKALVTTSFIGMTFFIIAGGVGERKPSNVDLGNDELNYIVDAYDSIGSYGTKGIFKVLNMCKDSNDVPYYLFAADLVFQGKLNDPNRHISETNIYFRNELSAYTKFSRDTSELLLKYGDKEIRNAILYGTDDIWSILNPIFTNPDFQEDFRQLINEFNMETYFINLTLSLGVSIARHLNETSFSDGLDPLVGELLSILFNENYHCDVIPYEASLDYNVTLPTLDPTILITRDDVNLIYEILISYLNKTEELKGQQIDEIEYGLELAREIIPHLANLSILRTSNRDKINPVLKRLYAYISYKFLQGTDEYYRSAEYSKKYYISQEYESISWIDEINYLIGICDEIIDLYKDISKLPFNAPEEAITSIFTLFSNESENINRLETIIRFIANSKIIGEILKTNLIITNIEFGLSALCSDYKMPLNINYANSFSSDGALFEYGELYYLLNAIEALALDEENANLLISLTTSDNPDDTLNIVKELFACLNESSFKGKKVMEYASESTVFNSIFSNIIYNLDLGSDITFYQDDEVLIKYDNDSYIIEKNEFKLLTSKISGLLDLINPLLNEYSDENLIHVLENKELMGYFESKIIANTVSNVAIDSLSSIGNGIIVPKDADANEMKRLISIIQNDKYDIDLTGLFNGDFSSFVVLLEDDELFDDAYSSLILSATISNSIDGFISEYGYKELVHNNFIYDSKILSYQKTEIKEMINSLKILEVDLSKIVGDESADIVDIIKDKLLKVEKEEIENIWNSYIISNIISRQLEINLLNVVNDKNKLRDKNIFETENNFFRFTALEVFNFKRSLVESLGITDLNNFEVDENIIFDLYVDGMDNQPKIDIIYNSLLACYVVSDNLDKILTENIGLGGEINYSEIKESSISQYPIYKKEEIISFFKCLRNVFNINDKESLDNVNYVNILNDIDSTSIDLLYESNICKFIISLNLDQIITKDYIDPGIRDSNSTKVYIKEKGNTYSYYKKEELEQIVHANKKLNFFNNGEFSVPDQDALKRIDLDEIYNSFIIKGVITKQVKNEILNKTSFLIDTPLAYDSIDNKKSNLLKLNELKALINLIDVDATLENLKLDDLRNCLDDSTILWASLSEHLISTEDIIVVDQLITKVDEINNFIDKAELKKLLSSANYLGFVNTNDLNNVSKGLIDKDRLDDIFESLILRTTIAKNLSIKDENGKKYYLYAMINECDKYTLKNVTYYSMKKDVLTKTFNMFFSIASHEDGMNYQMTTDYSVLFKWNYDDLTTPLLVIISQYLSDKNYKGGVLTINFTDYMANSIYVCNLFSQSLNDVKVFDDNNYKELKNYF